MQIGDKILLHKVPFPYQSQDVDEFIAITITEEKNDVPCAWTCKPKYKGYRAIGDNGDLFEANWDSFPSDSMTPFWMWMNRTRGEYWYDVVYITHTTELIFAPIFLQKYNFINYCDRHGQLYYIEREIGCFDCYMERKYNKPREKQIHWKGWR